MLELGLWVKEIIVFLWRLYDEQNSAGGVAGKLLTKRKSVYLAGQLHL